MSRENSETIEVYEKYGDKYLERNAKDIINNPKAKADNDEQIRRIKRYLVGLDKNAKIFEIGSASGRDAKTFQSFGYQNIIVSDAANYFLDILKKEGFSPLKFNLITDDFDNKYDFVFCWAVLVHFKKDEAKTAIKKIFNALNDNGRIALCVKRKEKFEENWDDFGGKIGAKRYFSYWDKNELLDCMKKTGFKNILIETTDGARSNWLECYAEK